MTEKQKINKERRRIATEFHQRSLVYHRAKRALALRYYELEPNYAKVAHIFKCSSSYAKIMVRQARKEKRSALKKFVFGAFGARFKQDD